jgi:hypothetical protein
MHRSILLGAALAASCGLAAYAQPTSPQPAAPAAAAAPAASAAQSAGAGLKEGMVVKDSTGVTVGTISRVGKTADGSAAVMINVDGKDVGLLAANLTVDPTGAQAVSNVTKAQLTGASAPAAKSPG